MFVTTSMDIKVEAHLTSNFGALVSEENKASVNRASINSETSEEKQSFEIDTMSFGKTDHSTFDFENDRELGKRRTTYVEIAQKRLEK